jgi:hypothetical protein
MEQSPPLDHRSDAVKTFYRESAIDRNKALEPLSIDSKDFSSKAPCRYSP